jgi:hypothetical protein
LSCYFKSLFLFLSPLILSFVLFCGIERRMQTIVGQLLSVAVLV